MIEVYHVEVEARFCKVAVIVNGFPVFSANGLNAPVTVSNAVNVALVGTNNSLRLVSQPDITNLGRDFSAIGFVKKYVEGDVTGPENGEIIGEFHFENMPAGEIRFSNTTYNFSDILLDTNPVTDKELLTEYALWLQDLFKTQNLATLLKEFSPKFHDYNLAFPTDVITDEEFMGYLHNHYFPNNPLLDFSKEEIFLDSWCDDRVWQISVGLNRREFMATRPDSKNLMYMTDIYVANVNNELKVVR